jgi:hypothetical protein
MFNYEAYGLHLASDIELPDLRPMPGAGVPDAVIRRTALEGFPKEIGTDGLLGVQVSDDGVRIGLTGFGHFLVAEGREILYDPPAGADPTCVIPSVLGMGLGVLLHQRGVFTLHASGIEHDGACVAFVAHKGTGKSTTCANLHRRGYRVVTDDILAVTFNEAGSPLVHPAFPLVKLRPDAVPSIGVTAEDLPRIDARYERRRLDVSGSFSSEPLPLKQLFLLEDGDEIELIPLAGSKAFIQLLVHSYIVRILGRAAAGVEHFRDCERLVSGIPITCARRPRGLENLPGFLSVIEEALNQPHDSVNLR